MPIVDFIHSDLCERVGEVEFLADGVRLVHIFGRLDLHIHLAPIHGVGDGVSKVFYTHCVRDVMGSYMGMGRGGGGLKQPTMARVFLRGHFKMR